MISLRLFFSLGRFYPQSVFNSYSWFMIYIFSFYSFSFPPDSESLPSFHCMNFDFPIHLVFSLFHVMTSSFQVYRLCPFSHLFPFCSCTLPPMSSCSIPMSSGPTISIYLTFQSFLLHVLIYLTLYRLPFFVTLQTLDENKPHLK